jgi:hypothetical protein
MRRVDEGAGNPRCGRVPRGWLTACLLLVGVTGAGAHTRAVRLHWRPSPDAGTVGYHLYVRPADGTYGAPLDVGLPHLGSRGMLRFDLAGLDLETAYAFGVTAYGADGAESRLSNELTLGTCAPILGVEQFQAASVRNRWHLTAEGSFGPRGDLSERFAGVGLTILGPDGAVLYAATAPRRAFRHDRGRRSFRLRSSARWKGIRQLTVTAQPETTEIAMRAVTRRAAVCDQATPVTWIVQLAGECVFRPEPRLRLSRAESAAGALATCITGELLLERGRDEVQHLGVVHDAVHFHPAVETSLNSRCQVSPFPVGHSLSATRVHRTSHHGSCERERAHRAPLAGSLG